MQRLIIIFLLLLIGCNKPNPKDNLAAVCKVNRLGASGHGTGIHIGDGYILTAAHVVDSNSDGQFQFSEYVARVTFESSIAETHTAVILYMGNFKKIENDLALLRIPGPIKRKGVKVSSNVGDFGESIYTIGHPKGLPPHITSGNLSYHSYYTSYISCPVFFGNSGGAVFNDNGEAIGIVSRVDSENIDVEIPYLGPNGQRHFTMAYFPYFIVNSGQMINLRGLNKILKNFGLNTDKEKTNLPYYIGGGLIIVLLLKICQEMRKLRRINANL